MKPNFEDLLARCKERLEQGSYYSHAEAIRVVLADVIMPELEAMEKRREEAEKALEFYANLQQGN